MIHKITRHGTTIKVRSHCLITVIDDHTKPITVVKLGMGDLQCILLDPNLIALTGSTSV